MRKRHEPSTLELVAYSQHLDILVLLDGVTRGGVSPCPDDCRSNTRRPVVNSSEQDHGRLENFRTFRTASQTVKVPPSTSDDSSNDGVAVSRTSAASHPHNEISPNA